MGIVTLSLSILMVVSGQVRAGYINCTETYCVDDDGVTCSANGRACDCPPGMLGDARVVCVNPGEKCACIVHGDPHVVQLTNNKIDLPIPCAHTLAKIDITSEQNCRVEVRGRAEFTNPGSLDTRSLEQLVHVKISWGPKTFTAIFDGETTPITSLESYGYAVKPSFYQSNGVSVSDSEDLAGYYTITHEPCQIALKYRGSNAFFGLVIPAGTEPNAGICGSCTDDETTPPSKKEVLELMLKSLWRQSPVDGKDMNSDQSCTALTKSVLDCPDGRIEFAKGYCNVMFLNETIKECIGERGEGGNIGILATYAQCYERVCNDGGTCAEYRGFLSNTSCDVEEHINTFMEKENFCFNEEEEEAT